MPFGFVARDVTSSTDPVEIAGFTGEIIGLGYSLFERGRGETGFDGVRFQRQRAPHDDGASRLRLEGQQLEDRPMLVGDGDLAGAGDLVEDERPAEEEGVGGGELGEGEVLGLAALLDQPLDVGQGVGGLQDDGSEVQALRFEGDVDLDGEDLGQHRGLLEVLVVGLGERGEAALEGRLHGVDLLPALRPQQLDLGAHLEEGFRGGGRRGRLGGQIGHLLCVLLLQEPDAADQLGLQRAEIVLVHGEAGLHVLHEGALDGGEGGDGSDGGGGGGLRGRGFGGGIGGQRLQVFLLGESSLGADDLDDAVEMDVGNQLGGDSRSVAARTVVLSVQTLLDTKFTKMMAAGRHGRFIDRPETNRTIQFFHQ